MNGIPQHTRALVERLLDAYCARICPPLARNTVVIGYRLESDHVIIHELQRILGVTGTRQPVPVARFRYRQVDNDWTLDYFDGTSWQRYRPKPRSHGFLELLREFDLDPAGIFWGRLDGKSLRWCRSSGRCLDCDVRYKQVLGLAVPIAPPGSNEAQASVISVTSTRR